MEREFANAVTQRPPKVLGAQLLPLRIGHKLLLERIACPVLCGGTFTLQDLMAAVLICSRSFADANKLHRERLLPLKIWLWSRRFAGFDIAKEILAFRNYIEAGCSCPELKVDASDGRNSGAPYTLRLVQFCREKLGMTDAQAWEFPLARANWEWATWWEGEGSLKIKNEAERELEGMFARMRAEDAAKEAQHGSV